MPTLPVAMLHPAPPKPPARIGRPPGSQNIKRDPSQVKPKKPSSAMTTVVRSQPASHGSPNILVLNPGSYELRFGVSDSLNPRTRKMVAAVRYTAAQEEVSCGARNGSVWAACSHPSVGADTQVLKTPPQNPQYVQQTQQQRGTAGESKSEEGGGDRDGEGSSTTDASSTSTTMTDKLSTSSSSSSSPFDADARDDGMTASSFSSTSSSPTVWAAESSALVEDDELTPEEVAAYTDPDFQAHLLETLVAREAAVLDIEERYSSCLDLMSLNR